MSRTDTPCAVWFLWALAQPEELDEIVAAATTTFAAIGRRKPARMIASIAGRKPRTSAYSPAKLTALAGDPMTLTVAIHERFESPYEEVKFYVRDDPRENGRFARYQTDRHIRAISTSCQRIDEPAILEFLRTAARTYRIIHGGAAWAPNVDSAITEAIMTGFGGSVDRATIERTHFDAMNVHAGLRLARRLYPVTIFGPELWARLPPMPQAAPMPQVTDLGDCKMVKAWHELVAPRDPAFLAGTRALRRWLWPHTIQNPADDPELA